MDSILLNEKFENLKQYLKKLQKVAVAFSSGVDSTFLLSAAVEVLGRDNVVAFSAKSCSFPKRELDEAVEFCKNNHIKHEIIESEELDIESFKQNPPNRCYLCKRELFGKIKENALKYDIKNIIEGSNLDDNNDYRPGHRAIEELGIKSPLRAAQLTKKEIRILSEKRNLKTFNKPSFACLSSRFEYGETITKEKLKMVELAEQFLLDKGFYQVRARIHNKLARIEILENEFSKLMEEKTRKEIVKEFKRLGFSFVSMDLQGFRSGSMNETLKDFKNFS